MSPTEITLPTITDAHVHLRQGEMVRRVAPYSAQVCGHLIVMPNTTPPITAGNLLSSQVIYERALNTSWLPPQGKDFRGLLGDRCTRVVCEVYMTAKLLPSTTPEDVKAVKAAGGIGFKLYPAGATTNSDDGIPVDWLRTPPSQFMDVLYAMEEAGLVLLCHGEMPDRFCLDRENAFAFFAVKATRLCPKLRFTWEHLTTAAGVKFVQDRAKDGYPILGTITAHHLLLTLDDVVGGKLRPDHFCMPIAKRPEDKEALINAATGGNSCFAFGSDSAPHTPDTKYCSHGCAGVFSAPVMLETLCEVFEQHAGERWVDNLAWFCVENANRFYGFETPKRTVTLVKESWTVPATCGGIIPFRAGQEIQWRVK